jgi:hypothetical protein
LRRNDEIINDRIDVLTRGLMGLTVVCARCHDHKYDPIPTADFYALHGVLNSTEDLTVLPEIEAADGKANPELRAGYEQAKTQASEALTTFTKGIRDAAIADVKDKLELYFDALCQLEFQKKDIKKVLSDTKLLETALPPLQQQWTAFKKTASALEDPVLAPLARIVAATANSKLEVLEAVRSSG